MTRKSSYQSALVTPAKFTSELINLLPLCSSKATNTVRSVYFRLIDVMLQMHAHQDTVTMIIAQVVGKLTLKKKKIRPLKDLQQILFELTTEVIQEVCTGDQVNTIKKDLGALQDIFNEAYKLNEPYQSILLLGLWYNTIEAMASSKMNVAKTTLAMEHAVRELIAALKTNEKKAALSIFQNFFPDLVQYIK
jgi:hypothetical protein